jgi:hypothetical protein
VEGYLFFDRSISDVCLPIELTVALKINVEYEFNTYYVIDLPGFTTAACTEPENAPIADAVAVPIITEDDVFSAQFSNGDYRDMFAGSKLYLRVITPRGLFKHRTHVIRIDRSFGLKISGVLPSMTQVNVLHRLRNVATGPAIDYVTTTPGFLEFQVGAGEYRSLFYRSGNVTFFPAHLGNAMDITIKDVMLATSFSVGDSLLFSLPGFTDKGEFAVNADGKVTWQLVNSLGTALRTFVDVPDASGQYTWRATWIEGSSANQYLASKLQLVLHSAPQAVPAGSYLPLPRFPRTFHLSSVVGRPKNHPGFTVSADIVSLGLKIPTTNLHYSEAIGPVCPNACSGHGICDDDIGRCVCDPGYGSETDVTSAHGVGFAPDCSSRACPRGVAWAHSPLDFPVGAAVTSTHGAHKSVECSAGGTCDRVLGKCVCFPGYEGAACERRSCPNDCSGNGMCLPMWVMTLHDTALPLRISTPLDNKFYRKYVDSTTYDGEAHQGCVCDSSWSVGLGSGQTQLGEYFGAACQYRRCPSGDDPVTGDQDETDCEGVRQPDFVFDDPQSGVGQPGNLCYVPCSNRGTCDYDTGICKCFKGFYGANCGFFA